MSADFGEPSGRPQIDVRFWDERIAVVTVIGKVDVYGAVRLREAFTTLNEQGFHRLLVDLGRVSDIDSTGLGVIIGALKRVRSAGGFLDLACDQEGVLSILRTTRLIEMIRVFPSQATARMYL